MLRADPHALLRISAELHAAADQPDRWPRAWRAVCDFFRCPAVLGMGEATPPGGADAVVHVAERVARAHDCVRARSGACAATDPAHFDACSALLPHLHTALLRTTSLHGDPRATALEALPYALFVCDSQRRLLHVNAAGRCELDSAGWLREDGGRLVGADPAIDRRLASMFTPQQAGIAQAGAAAQERHFELYRGDGAIAYIVGHASPPSGGLHRWVLRLTPHAPAAEIAGLDALADALGLTPRQRVLAALLLDGWTLTDAARHMGIVRGTANDLLKRLFDATGTRRQPELVTFLMRRIASR